MTVKALSYMLAEAEKNTPGGVSITFFTILHPTSALMKMQGYVTWGTSEKRRTFTTEDRLTKILFALAGGGGS